MDTEVDNIEVDQETGDLSGLAVIPSCRNVLFLQEEEMNTAVDNIEVDQETGDLWIGCHSIL